MNIFKNRPPILILLICLFEILGLLLLPSAFSSETSVNLGLWYQVYLFISGILSIAIIYSLWRMKKIAVLIYTGSYALHNIVAVITGTWMAGVIIIPLIGLAFIGLNRTRFS